MRLLREFNLPLGIEASGYTLETVAAIDPDWLSALRRLTSEGYCEFIGTGDRGRTSVSGAEQKVREPSGRPSILVV